MTLRKISRLIGNLISESRLFKRIFRRYTVINRQLFFNIVQKNLYMPIFLLFPLSVHDGVTGECVAGSSGNPANSPEDRVGGTLLLARQTRAKTGTSTYIIKHL